MQIPDKTYIVILLIVILGLSFASYWRFNDFNKSLSEIDLPKIEMPETNLDDFMPTEKENYHEWISPDGKLKLEYSANWTELSELFSQYPNQSGINLTDSEVLFFAHRLKIKEQALAFLTINQFNAEEGLEKIIEKIKQTPNEQNGKIEIIEIKNEGEIIWLEIVSERSSQPNFYSKGKLIFDEEKTYLILFTVKQTDWSNFEEEANEIFNSAELL